MKKSQYGRSMVEMLGVLAIIGVLSVGGIAGYSAAMEKYRINKALEIAQLVIQETRTMYASQGNYNDLGMWNSLGVEPSSDTSVAASIGKRFTSDSPYAFSLNEFPLPSNNNISGFMLGISMKSESACVAIASQNWAQYGDDFAGLGSYDNFSVAKAIENCAVKDEYTGESFIIIMFYPAVN